MKGSVLTYNGERWLKSTRDLLKIHFVFLLVAVPNKYSKLGFPRPVNTGNFVGEEQEMDQSGQVLHKFSALTCTLSL